MARGEKGQSMQGSAAVQEPGSDRWQDMTEGHLSKATLVPREEVDNSWWQVLRPGDQ